MDKLENNAYFWQKIDTLFLSNSFELTKKKGEAHLEFPNLIYPVDYGYLKDTLAYSKGVKVFRGSLKKGSVQAVVVVADILKKDVEAKILVGCTESEETNILYFLNQTDLQKSVLIRRDTIIPIWGETE